MSPSGNAGLLNLPPSATARTVGGRQGGDGVLAVIPQNVAFALAVKLVFVVLNFAGYSSLWAAIAADTGASLLVIFNGLRLLRAGNRL